MPGWPTAPDGADISATGFNDMPFVDRISPALTTMRIQHADMWRQAAESSHAEREFSKPAPREIVLESQFVRRASSAPVPTIVTIEPCSDVVRT